MEDKQIFNLALASFLAVAFSSAIFSIEILYLKSIGFSDQQIGMIYSTLSILIPIIMFISANKLDHTNKLKVLKIFAMLFPFTIALLYISKTFILYFLVRLIFAIMLSEFSVLLLAVAMEISYDEKSLGKYFAFPSIGGSLACLVTGFLSKNIGFIASFIFAITLSSMILPPLISIRLRENHESIKRVLSLKGYLKDYLKVFIHIRKVIIKNIFYRLYFRTIGLVYALVLIYVVGSRDPQLLTILYALSGIGAFFSGMLLVKHFSKLRRDVQNKIIFFSLAVLSTLVLTGKLIILLITSFLRGVFELFYGTYINSILAEKEKHERATAITISSIFSGVASSIFIYLLFSLFKQNIYISLLIPVFLLIGYFIKV